MQLIRNMKIMFLKCRITARKKPPHTTTITVEMYINSLSLSLSHSRSQSLTFYQVGWLFRLSIRYTDPDWCESMEILVTIFKANMTSLYLRASKFVVFNVVAHHRPATTHWEMAWSAIRNIPLGSYWISFCMRVSERASERERESRLTTLMDMEEERH